MRYRTRKQVPAEIESLILAQAKGRYQADLLRPAFYETWSGSTLQGKAKNYGGRYGRARKNLVDRINIRLQDQGWFGAYTDLVWDLDRKRWVRELILIGPRGGEYVFRPGRYAHSS